MVRLKNKYDARVMPQRIKKADKQSIEELLNESYASGFTHAIIERALELGLDEDFIRRGRPWLDRCFSIELIKKDAELHGIEMKDLKFHRLLKIAK